MTPEQREMFLQWCRMESAFWRRRERESRGDLDHAERCHAKWQMFEAAIKEFSR